MQTGNSYLNYTIFHDKSLVDKCVLDITNNLVEYPKIKIFGKVCYQQRCVGFFSNEIKQYKYSNQISLSKPMTSSLTTLLSQVNNLYGTTYNAILVNKYKSGKDYISRHSDDETNLDNSGVVSISYGATRKFRVRDKKTKKILKDINLEPYSIIQMGGKFQEEFTHEVPIQKKITDERISFTFRKHNQ